jgi:CelD/BcsL family acetyltransferase involved in cellulose biosynthesis
MYAAPSVVEMIECSVDDSRWQELVAGDPDALPFHHPAWSRLLAEAYGFKAFVLALAGDDGALTAGVPVVEVQKRSRKRWISLPFTDSCQPLASGDTLAVFASSLESARQAAGVTSYEVRAELPSAQIHQKAALLHVLPLTGDPEEIAQRFRASVRRNIRAAQRTDAVVRTASHERDLTERFYDLHVGVRRRLGLPVQPLRFFRLLWSRMIEPGLGRVLLVDVNGETVAGAVFLTWNGNIVYKYGASEPRYWPLRPNNLLFWEAIKSACENGFDRFDFGRTDLDSASLRQFKLGWGTDELPLQYSVLGEAGRPGGVAPPRIVRGAIRHSPRWVARALGEIFYRRAA